MHAYAIVGNIDNLEEEAVSFAQNLADKNDILIDAVSKISEVKKLIADTGLSYNKPYVIILKNFDNASTEAQNAFLKKLEEAQDNLYFVLTAKNENSLLETILSRVSVKKISQKKEVDESSLEFLNSDTPTKFQMVENIKKRDEAKEFLENLINAVDTHHIKKLETLDKAYNNINSNGNVNLQLTNMIIELE